MITSKALFIATAAVTTLFIITILAMVAMLSEDAQSSVNVWFNKYGATILMLQVAGIGLLGMAAMIADRRETLDRSQKKDDAPDT